jgi:hypothetical protein
MWFKKTAMDELNLQNEKRCKYDIRDRILTVEPPG